MAGYKKGDVFFEISPSWYNNSDFIWSSASVSAIPKDFFDYGPPKKYKTQDPDYEDEPLYETAMKAIKNTPKTKRPKKESLMEKILKLRKEN